ncbi:MAG: type II toxin-antitoxin system prevent-host-death family antitoxin [Arachnia sp.]
MTTITARDFNRDVSAAKRAADQGPVTITDRGIPAYVLLTAEAYSQLTDKRSIVEWLRCDDDIVFEPARLDDLPRAAEL